MTRDELIRRIDELKAKIDALRPIKPEQERRIMDKFRLDWNYHSNAIEGNRLTLGETKVLLLEGLTAHGKPLKDSLDIKGHNEVLNYLESFVHKKEALTEAVIRELHRVLLHEPYQVEARTSDGQKTMKWVKLGEYKTEPNFALSPDGQSRDFSLPQDVPVKMAELIDWLRDQSTGKLLHPIEIAATFHHRFVRIHPFDDGNGRMARILMNLIAMQNGFQPIIVKVDRKPDYISALIRADAGEDNEFISFIINEEIASQELFLRGAQGGDISDFDDIDKKIFLLKQELSDVVEPLELSRQVQVEFVSNIIKPCIGQLIKKLAQFDDFYKENSFVVNGNIWADQKFSNVMGWPLPQNSLTRADFAEAIQAFLNEQYRLFHSINFYFNWSGFKKAGTNTFADSCTISFNFNKHQYSVLAQHPPRAGVVASISRVYQLPPSPDEISKIVRDMTEACYLHIDRTVHQK